MFRDTAFAENSRKLNALFAYTSVGTKELDLGRGPPTYKIQGQLVHNIGSYLPPDGKAPSFAQVYVLDAQEQLELRSNRGAATTITVPAPPPTSTLNSSVAATPTITISLTTPPPTPGNATNAYLNETMQDHVGFLQDFMLKHNSFATTLMSLNDVIQRERDDGVNEEDLNLNMYIRPRQGRDSRTHNAPVFPEMGICIQDKGEFIGRDVVVIHRKGHMQQVSEVSSAYNPLQYP
ncbi:hypothetical protein AeMF1_020636 [Aphanomyces euteiches]|nr:hypothetical protein AeMF1_020636 [Aphanomyces euteiches]